MDDAILADAILADVIGIIICLFLSAFFSGSETALTSLSGPQAQRLAEESNSRWLELWVEKPIEVLTAILIGNNIVNITASALATDLADRLFENTAYESWAIPVVVGVMTFLLLTFGEITPKTLAKRMHKRLAGPVMLLLTVPFKLFKPLIWLFMHLTRGVMRLVGEDPEHRTPFVTSEEIEYMIDLGSREGTFSEDRERLLRSAFEFTDTAVREIMVPRTEMVALSMDMNLDEVIDATLGCGHSRLPVYEESVDNIRGLFYAKDLIGGALTAPERRASFRMREHLREPYFVPESKRIAELLAEFQRQRTHMAIVVDEFGGTAGLVTLEDIIEEIFGEIQDEYDTEPEQLTVIDELTVRADARITISDIETHYDMEFPDHPDYETLGGFLMAQSGNVPSPDDEVMWEDLVFRVLEADQKRVISVEIRRIPRLDEESEQSLDGGGGEQGLAS